MIERQRSLEDKTSRLKALKLEIKDADAEAWLLLPSEKADKIVGTSAPLPSVFFHPNLELSVSIQTSTIGRS